MNELATVSFGKSVGLPTRDDVARGLNNMSMEAPRVGGQFQFLKLDKGNGDWTYGQEETVVEDGSLWAVNPLSLEYGWIAWDKNQQVEGEVMVPITMPLPDKNSLRVRGSTDGQPTGQNGWQYQQSVVLVCVSGEDSGVGGTPPVMAQYKQSSVGSQKLFKSLVDAVQAQVNKGSDAIVPIIEMKSDPYKHKKYGKIFNPIFEIKEFRALDDGGEGAAEPAAPEKAARTRTAKPVEKPAAAPEIPAEGSADEEAALAAEYEAEAGKTAGAQDAQAAIPRRRTRR